MSPRRSFRAKSRLRAEFRCHDRPNVKRCVCGMQDWLIDHVNEDTVCPVAALTPTAFRVVSKCDDGASETAQVHHIPADWMPQKGAAAADCEDAEKGTATESCARSNEFAAPALPQVSVQRGGAAASARVECTCDGDKTAGSAAQGVARGLAALTACACSAYSPCRSFQPAAGLGFFRDEGVVPLRVLLANAYEWRWHSDVSVLLRLHASQWSYLHT